MTVRWWELTLITIIMMAASATFGLIIGFLAGQGELGSLIILASTVITAGGVGAGGLGLFSGFRLNGHFTTKVIPSLNVVAFGLTFLVYSQHVDRLRIAAARHGVEAQFQALANCTLREANLRDMREQLGLKPLVGLCKEWSESLQGTE